MGVEGLETDGKEEKNAGAKEGTEGTAETGISVVLEEGREK